MTVEVELEPETPNFAAIPNCVCCDLPTRFHYRAAPRSLPLCEICAVGAMPDDFAPPASPKFD